MLIVERELVEQALTLPNPEARRQLLNEGLTSLYARLNHPMPQTLAKVLETPITAIEVPTNSLGEPLVDQETQTRMKDLAEAAGLPLGTRGPPEGFVVVPLVERDFWSTDKDKDTYERVAMTQRDFEALSEKARAAGHHLMVMRRDGVTYDGYIADGQYHFGHGVVEGQRRLNYRDPNVLLNAQAPLHRALRFLPEP